MNLLCLSDFNQGDVCAKAGDVLTFSDGVANRLLDSWPGCWAAAGDPSGEVVLDSRLAEIVAEAIEAPPADKMMHAPHKAKAHKRK